MTDSTKCPRCQSPLVERDIKDTQVDVCHTCSGIFFDAGELQKVADGAYGNIEYCTMTDDVLETNDGMPACECPKCDRHPRMRKVEFLSYSDIVLDHCDHCKGIWVDGGELESINKRLASHKDIKLPWMVRLQLMLGGLPI